MTTDAEMTDAEVAAQIARADRFIERVREAISDALANVDAGSACAVEHRRGLQRIAETLDATGYVVFANLANLDTVMRGAIMSLIEVKLLAVGGGPTLDYPDATALFAEFKPMIEAARRRKIN
jgi:hypothetical protein